MLRKFGESPTDRYLTGDWWRLSPMAITSAILADFEVGDKAAAMMRLESCEYADNYLEITSRFRELVTMSVIGMVIAASPS